MDLKNLRKYRRSLEKTSGIFHNNPVLVLGLGLPFAVIASTTLRRGVLMSAVVFAVSLMGFFVSRALKRTGETCRVVVTCLFCISALTVVAVSGIFPVLIDDLGLYLPLAAANMMLVTAIRPAEIGDFRRALNETILSCLGFTLVMCLLSAFREFVALHTLWDVPVRFNAVAISGAGLPCFGFILLGVLAAFSRKLDRGVSALLISRDNRPSGAGEGRP